MRSLVKRWGRPGCYIQNNTNHGALLQSSTSELIYGGSWPAEHQLKTLTNECDTKVRLDNNGASLSQSLLTRMPSYSGQGIGAPTFMVGRYLSESPYTSGTFHTYRQNPNALDGKVHFTELKLDCQWPSLEKGTKESVQNPIVYYMG